MAWCSSTGEGGGSEPPVPAPTPRPIFAPTPKPVSAPSPRPVGDTGDVAGRCCWWSTADTELDGDWCPTCGSYADAGSWCDTSAANCELCQAQWCADE